MIAPDDDRRIDVAEAVREELEDRAASDRFKVAFKTVSNAVPIEAAIEESRRGYDVLIVGAGRQWGLEHKSFGSRAEALLARAPTSVIVVRQGARRNANAEEVPARHRARYATIA